MGQLDEADLTASAMAGDERAFERLVRMHQASVRALSRRLAGTVGDGDDIAQSAFLIAWRRRESWRGGSFRAWVCAIAYREFLQARRNNPAFAPESEATDESAAPHDAARIDLLRAFKELAVNERAAIALCLGAGMSHAEAAFAMSAPLGSVKSWVNRGRTKLQRILAAYEKV